MLREEYEEAQKNYSRTQNQLQQLDEKHRNVLNSLQKENAESHAIITMLNAQHEEEKKQLIQQLRSHTERVEQLENRLAEYDVLTIATSNGDIGENLHKLADAGRKASVLELRRLRDYAYREAPSFHDAITKAKSPLSIREENICVMIRQGFMASEIAILFGMSPQSLSNSKKRILKNMFGLDGKASDLNEEIIRI